MSISLVYKSTISSTAEPVEIIFYPKLQDYLSYKYEFLSAHPEVTAWDQGPFTLETKALCVDLEFPDQSTLDLYLADGRNMLAAITAMKADPEVVEYCNANGITQTIDTLENTNKEGLRQLTVEIMDAEIFSN
jgi:hypothetical protein